MPAENYANNASTTVATSSTGTTTGSKTVAATTSFPQTGQFRILVESEYIVAQVVDATHLNFLQRAVEGTTAADHAVGVTITHIVTAEGLWAIRNPLLSRVTLEDDFIFGFDNANANAPKGALNWYVSGGAGVQQYIPGISGHPGIIELSTGASTNGTVTLNSHVGGNDAGILPAEMFDQTWIVRLGQASDANTVVQFGFRRDANALPAAMPSDGIYLEKQGADTDWFYVCRAAGTQTRVDSLVACGTGWVIFRARRTDASTIAFSINGGTESTVTTNVPTVALQPSFAAETLTTAAKLVDVDYFGLLLTGITRA